MNRLLFSFIFFLCLFHHSTSGAFVITSHNLQWYGLGGHPRSYIGEDAEGKLQPYNEYRDFHLKRFFEQHMSGSDIVFFQEVVAVEHLIDKIIPKNFYCETYKGHYKWKHQYILACVKNEIKVTFDTLHDLIVENANVRPGLIVNLLDDDGSIKMRLVGVHLKAGRNEPSQNLRNSQLSALAEWFANQKDVVPTIILGDFNQDSNLRSDPVRPLFAKVGLLEHSRFKSTLPTSFRALDRFFVSEGFINQIKSSWAFRACVLLKPDYNEKDLYLDATFFRRFVSDHCPVSIEF